MAAEHLYEKLIHSIRDAYDNGDLPAFKQSVSDMANAAEELLKAPGVIRSQRKGSNESFPLHAHHYFSAVLSHLEHHTNPVIHMNENGVNKFYIGLIEACLEVDKFSVYENSLLGYGYHPAGMQNLETLQAAEKIELVNRKEQTWHNRYDWGTDKVFWHKENSFQSAVMRGNTDLAKHYLKNLEIQFDMGVFGREKSKRDWLINLTKDAFVTAAANDRKEIVEFLLDRFSPENGFQPIHEIFDMNEALVGAARRSSPQMIQRIIELGGRPDPNGNSKTPLEYAAEAGNLEGVKFLYPLTNDTMKNLDPIIAAKTEGHAKVVEWLFPKLDISLIPKIKKTHKKRIHTAMQLSSRWEKEQLISKHGLDSNACRNVPGL